MTPEPLTQEQIATILLGLIKKGDPRVRWRAKHTIRMSHLRLLPQPSRCGARWCRRP
jgi:hypothetical protein